MPTLSRVCFLNETPTTDISTLSLHDALPILSVHAPDRPGQRAGHAGPADGQHLGETAQGAWRRRGDRADAGRHAAPGPDRKNTRLNSSQQIISYAVLCLAKKHISSTYHPLLI